MGINEIILYIMVVFLIIGAIDKCFGNRWGFGQGFTDAFMAMGPLTLAMVGIVSLAPVIARGLTPIVEPIFGLVGADPATFANMMLALDMGGYALAVEMSHNKDAELFAWVFLGTMMGPTIVFTIPIALGMIRKEDQPFFAKGILVGIITIPIGCLIGGLIAGFNLIMILLNLIPAMIFSLCIAYGLWKATTLMIKGFRFFGKAIEIVAIVGLTANIIETLTGITVIPNLIPLDEGIQVVGMIVIVLAGAFPMIAFIQKIFHSRLKKIGKILGVSETATTGIIASLAHVIPMFTILKEMDNKGKVINVAFAVSGAFVLGGHLGFVAGIQQEMVFAMMIGKLTAGFSAIALAKVMFRNET
ncbi:ethanolamine utilization protein EutH [Halalkalibacter krulwichiae]|uniref:Ethanolamine utilization protein, EutH n=1 Tax=Halalkalibacter krulwichiae TaxID=199441 RepID=A0A1X9MHX7_9BACI|nr:ethanolamine utilization protein EutH [Halalkalibacter krulwichiae]ARK31201.1 Ethanolamine utilization protein, EutH [Halalkalibacter krulwichiae]